MIFSNPFKVFPRVLAKVEAKVAELDFDRLPNLTFHGETTHPRVSKKGPAIVPGWNASNRETKAREKYACYVLFDKRGQLVFQGRLTFAELEGKVGWLLGE